MSALVGARRFGTEQRTAWLMLSPMIVVLGVVAVFPVVYSLWISLFDLRLARPHRVPFVGLGNYAKLLGDDLFWTSVARTATGSPT